MHDNIIPRIANLGLFDFKLKYGSILISERRCVNSYEIELPMIDGGFSYIDNEIYPIEANRVICAKPGQWRRTEAPFVCKYIHIIPNDGEVCNILKTLPNSISLKNTDMICTLFDEIIQEYTKSAHNLSLMLYAKFLTLISELQLNCLNNTTVIKGRKVDVHAVEIAIDYINKNYIYKITLNDLSEIAHLSPIYFRQLFFDSTGMTPYSYILDKRVEKAKQLLALSNIPISNVAIDSGFTDQAYMGKVFKQITGYTPLKYRKTQNESYFK